MSEASFVLPTQFLYKAANYLRLSKEDGDFSSSPGKVESNSISSQRDLIRRFVEQHPNIELVKEYVDDGYTGTNFDRPQFQELLEAIERKEINCVIVKDLSRFGREYIDAGQYIEKLFPRYGIRFIAINDGIDTGSASTAADNLMIPFKNLINDSYSRDISIKVRSSFETKRRRGDFVSNFTCYGYRRDPSDKNKILIDAKAAEIVRDIFRWKIDGMSPDRISDRLNALGIDCPAAYKMANGSKYKSGFRKNVQMLWSAKAVIRILTNELYCGVLIQGKRTTPNYKVRKQFTKAESEWVRIENSHEAIIEPQEYRVVQRLMQEDARARGNMDVVRPLAGRVFCGDCGTRAKRKCVSTKNKTYAYYACPNSIQGGQCAPRTISEVELESAVLVTLQAQIALILDIKDRLSEEEAQYWESRELRKLEIAIKAQKEQIQKSENLIADIYEDYHGGVIELSEMTNLKKSFSKNIEDAEMRIATLTRELAETRDSLSEQESWFSQFQMYQNITALSRLVVVNLIDKILIYPEKRIQVVLRFQNQINELFRFADSVQSRDRTASESVKENT